MKQGRSVLPQWVRLGVLFDAAASRREVDLERLLLDTARALPENARILGTVSTWLSIYGVAVARHRLARLIRDELDPDHQPALGLLLESAVTLGGPRELTAVAKACTPTSPPRPLFSVQRRGAFREMAEKHASSLSRQWGLLAPEAEFRPRTIRPTGWLLKHNPSLRDRLIRKGDLRASIIETLRWDVPDARAISESELARLCGATRVAVRAALKSLELEGAVALNDARTNRRDNSVRLVA